MLILAFKETEGVTFEHPEGNVHMVLQGRVHKTKSTVVKLESNAKISIKTNEYHNSLGPSEERVAMIPEEGDLSLIFPGGDSVRMEVYKINGFSIQLGFDAPKSIKITRDNAKVKE